MSYKYSKGAQVIGDLKAADDAQRNTLIDFGEDQIDLQTSGSTRISITNDGATVNGTLFVDSENASTNEGIRFRKTGDQYRQIVFESDNSNAAQIQLDNNEQLNIDQLSSTKEIRFRVIGGGGEMINISSNGVKIADAYTLPTSDGTADQVLQTDGNGQLSFVDVDPGGGGGGSGGKVLQVVHTSYTASVSVNATTYATIGGFTAAITPSATSSKILIHLHVNAGLDGIGSDKYGVIKVNRSVGGVNTFVMGGEGNQGGHQDDVVFNTISTDPTATHERNLVYSATGLDSPNTTSTITYEVKARVDATGTPVMTINQTTANPSSFFHSPAVSSITLMEIDGS
jgi:hypothetical protein